MKFPYPLFYSSFRFCRLMRATITLLYCATLNKGFFYIYLTHELTPQHLNSKMVPVLPSLNPSLIFIFPLLPSPLYPTGFSFYIFPEFLVIFILLSSDNNNKYLPITSTWTSVCNFYFCMSQIIFTKQLYNLFIYLRYFLCRAALIMETRVFYVYLFS